MAQTNDFDLSDEVALVTGGGGILGSRFALALARNGARVAVVDLDKDRLIDTLKSVNKEYPNSIVTYESDIADKDSLLGLRESIKQDMGEVSILVNNAATKSDNFFEPFESFPVQDWEDVMRVNMTGVMLGCQTFGGPMARRGKGSIINILSIYGIAAPDQRIYEGSNYEGHAINTPAVYSASKAGVWGLTRYLATYWGEAGVRVNAITPGGIESGQNDVFNKRYSNRVPMGRMAERDEMCGALIFLASNGSSYITGHNIVVDGGLTVW